MFSFKLTHILHACFSQQTFTMTYYGDHAPQLAASVIALATLAYIVFGLRVYTRIHNGAWGVDDWCMATAIVSYAILLLSWN
jgi:hypothetical protein